VDAFLSGMAVGRARVRRAAFPKAASAALPLVRLRVRTSHGCRERRCTRRAKRGRDWEPFLAVI